MLWKPALLAPHLTYASGVGRRVSLEDMGIHGNTVAVFLISTYGLTLAIPPSFRYTQHTSMIEWNWYI